MTSFIKQLSDHEKSVCLYAGTAPGSGSICFSVSCPWRAKRQESVWSRESARQDKGGYGASRRAEFLSRNNKDAGLRSLEAGAATARRCFKNGMRIHRPSEVRSAGFTYELSTIQSAHCIASPWECHSRCVAAIGQRALLEDVPRGYRARRASPPPPSLVPG